MAKTTIPNDDQGRDLTITHTTRRAAGAGRWARGIVGGYRFDALVFPEHADNADYELGDSRISKLWVQRLADRATVYNWGRGLDVPATDAVVQQLVDALSAALAELVCGI